MSPVPVPSGPFEILAATHPVQHADKRHLLAVSRSIEARALGTTDPVTVWVCLQRQEFLTRRTAAVYRELTAHGVNVHIYGAGLTVNHAVPRATMHDLAWDDPLTQEWNVIMLSNGIGWAMAARELPTAPGTPDVGRQFEWITTDSSRQVSVAATALIGRDAPTSDEVADLYRRVFPEQPSAV
jgi:DICT domain-containing protein